VNHSIGIAGAGRVAQAMGRLLRERGCPIACVASRSASSAEAAAAFIGGDVEAVDYAGLAVHARRILIAVPDSAVANVANLIAVAEVRGGIALHTCGNLGVAALQQLTRLGVSCGTIHPLQTFATAQRGVASLPGCAFAINGDAPAVEWAQEIIALFEGEALLINDELRPLYHAGAAMASNHLMGLIDASRQLMEMAGVEPSTSLRALAPLLRTSLENALQLGPVAALTGPIERGDSETVRMHLRALNTAPSSIQELYRAAGLQVLGMARARGLSEQSAFLIEQALRGSHGEQ
jgi:predicted short-subunit dehydrogenase-like oxidoreductase (DUF2520 family)